MTLQYAIATCMVHNKLLLVYVYDMPESLSKELNKILWANPEMLDYLKFFDYLFWPVTQKEFGSHEMLNFLAHDFQKSPALISIYNPCHSKKIAAPVRPIDPKLKPIGLLNFSSASAENLMKKLFFMIWRHQKCIQSHINNYFFTNIYEMSGMTDQYLNSLQVDYIKQNDIHQKHRNEIMSSVAKTWGRTKGKNDSFCSTNLDQEMMIYFEFPDKTFQIQSFAITSKIHQIFSYVREQVARRNLSNMSKNFDLYLLRDDQENQKIFNSNKPLIDLKKFGNKDSIFSVVTILNNL